MNFCSPESILFPLMSCLGKTRDLLNWQRGKGVVTQDSFFANIRGIFFLNQIHFFLAQTQQNLCFFSVCVRGFDFFKQILWVPRRVGQIASRPSPNGGSGSGKCSKPGTFRFFGITLENLPNGIRSFDDRNIKNGTC